MDFWSFLFSSWKNIDKQLTGEKFKMCARNRMGTYTGRTFTISCIICNWGWIDAKLKNLGVASLTKQLETFLKSITVSQSDYNDFCGLRIYEMTKS